MESYQIHKFIDQLSFDELKKYVKGFIQEENEAGRKLFQYINLQLNRDGLHNAEVIVDYSFKATKISGNRYRQELRRDWDSIDHDSYRLFQRARNAIESGQPDIALTIATRWLEDFAEYFDEEELWDYEEEGVWIRSSCDDAEKIILRAITHENVSEPVRKDIMNRLFKLADHNARDLTSYIDLDSLATRVKLLFLTDEEALKMVEDRIQEGFDSTENLQKKRDLLLKLGRTDEAEAFIEENLNDRSIAQAYINQLFEAQRFEKLISILKKLTAPKPNDRFYRPDKTWLEKLAECQDLSGQKADATETYRQLFITSQGKLDYFHILKQRIPSERWHKFLDKLIKDTDSNGYGFKGQSYGDMLLADGQVQAFHDWLKGHNDILFFQNNLHRVPEELRKDLFPLYSNWILRIAQNVSQRKDYEMVCRHIERINKLPDGKEVAQEIASVLESKYSRRPAFMELLHQTLKKK